MYDFAIATLMARELTKRRIDGPKPVPRRRLSRSAPPAA